MNADRPQSDSGNVPPAGTTAGASTLLRSLFRQQDAFATVDDTALERLEQRMRPLHYEDGAIICEEGDPGGWIFVVAAGQVEVIKKARDGAMIQVNVLRPGNWGGMMSLSKNMPRSARLVARGKVELRSLDHDDLAEVLRQHPSLTMALLTCMSRRLGQDAIHLAATLRHVSAAGMAEVYARCAPDERLMLETIRHRVAAAESLDEIMEFSFESICHLRGCDRMSLMFIEDDGSRAVSHWTRAMYEPLVLPADYKEDLAGSVFEEALTTGRPRIIDDLAVYARQHPRSRTTRLLIQEGIRSTIVTPLIAGDKAVGFLVRYARRGGAFNDHDALLYQAIAGSISQPVEKAYRIEQLTQANNSYSEVLGFVSHELQSPIASMVTDAQLLLDGYLGELTDKQRRKLERSVAKGQYLLTLVRDYLNLARLESTSLQPDFRPEVDLRAQVIEPTIELVQSEIAAKTMTLERHHTEPVPGVECDVGMMRIAFANLLTNAVKYGRAGGVIRVATALADNTVRLSVWNEGPGFADTERNKLFGKFVRLDDPALRKEGGTGVGLYSTWRVMQLHRGHVAARSEQGAWAEFTLSLPIRQGEEKPAGTIGWA